MSQLRINDFSINWLSEDSHYFFDTNHPEVKEFETLASQMPFYPGHMYLFTSGFQKVALLSKEAFLISAEAVNKHLECESSGSWFIPLPLFHVAGLSVAARAFCGGYSFTRRKRKWKAGSFVQDLISQKASYTSLVPAQVYDLVKKKLASPDSLEFTLVGGGPLTPTLYKQARSLGWPLLPTYGMTETCSQVATAERSSLKERKFPSLKILPHMKLRKKKGVLEIKSSSLLTGYFDIVSKRFCDPKTSEGWFLTQDRGELENGLILKGRVDELVKISGRLVSLKKLSTRLEDIAREMAFKGDFCLTVLPHERKGNQLALVTDNYCFNELSQFLKRFNRNVPSYQKVKSIYMVDVIPRTSLQKVDRVALRNRIYL